MKILIDTNVLISAILRDKGPEAVILWILEQPDWEWIVSLEILSEYQEVLRRKKFSFQPHILQKWEMVFGRNPGADRTERRASAGGAGEAAQLKRR